MIRIKLLVIAILLMQVGPVPAQGPPFEKAVPGLALVFPHDHGKHPQFQTEWWYFTGNLEAEDASKWGFQLTFFRRSLFKKARRQLSSWGVRDLYPAHFALTDGQGRRFFHAELLSREGPGLAGAADNDLQVHVRDWSCQRQGETFMLQAAQDGRAVNLRLVSLKPIVLHGDSGYSRKGNAPDQASHYYSFSRLEAEGTIAFDGVTHNVRGLAWMDHEFGSSILRNDQAGWDWFGLQLDDGTDLMVFRLRKKNGALERAFGTLIPKNGKPVKLESSQILITPHRTWTSPHTAAVYPSSWTVEIPDVAMKLDVSPLVEDQELVPSRGMPVAYWEGAVTVAGSSKETIVHGRGYVELTGYAHSLGGRL